MTNEIYTDFKSKSLWEHVEPIEIQPTKTTVITLPDTLKSAAKSFLFIQDVFKNEASVYKFNVKASITCIIRYINKSLKDDRFTVFFNRDIEEDTDGYFTNLSTLHLQGNDIENIELRITNNSLVPLIIRSMAIYESDDIKVTTIAKVLKEDTISADLIQATSVFTDAIFTQILQTNALSRSVRRASVGDEVDYISAEGYEMGFYAAVLGEEQEQFSITTEIAGRQYEYKYWYSQIEGEDAYKYLTTIDPRDKFPDISDSNREAFAFMVYKPVSIAKKMSIEFALDELGNLTPSLIFGVGTGNGAGQGYIYKNSNGFYFIYTKENGDNVGFVIDELGVHITGWTDQHCESIVFKDNGVKLKFIGEDTHYFEYVNDASGVLTGIIQDQNYLTSISYEAGNI